MKINFIGREEIYPPISEYEDGTIILFCDKNLSYEDEDYWSNIGIITSDIECNTYIFDLKDNRLYGDIENYKVIDILEGEFIINR